MKDFFKTMKNEKIEVVIARLGLAFPFLYAAVSSILHPDLWVSFFPAFMISFIPQAVLIPVWAILQIVVGLWLIIGENILIPSALASIMLIGIFIFNLNLIDIIFRDVSILATAIALFISSYRGRNGFGR